MSKDGLKKGGELWHLMTDEEKQPYNDLADKSKQKYETQFEQLMENGYFIMDDGTKSTDSELKFKISPQKV